MTRLLLLLCLATACAHKESMPPEPEQSPQHPKAVAAQMDQMRALADEAIRRAVEAPGPVEARHAAGVFEIVAAMRPTFGPANAWLFGERGRKLAALAKALNVAEPASAGSLDAFFDSVDSAQTALAGKGLTVKQGRTDSSVLGYLPRTPGRALRAEDATRFVAEYVPYVSARGKAVHPSFTLHFIPLSSLSMHASMVTRDQPGRLVGAVNGALVFVQDTARSGDSDDGAIEKVALDALFGSAPPETKGEVKKHRGIAWVSLGVGAATPACPEGSFALSATRSEGANIEVQVVPP